MPPTPQPAVPEADGHAGAEDRRHRGRLRDTKTCRGAGRRLRAADLSSARSEGAVVLAIHGARLASCSAGARRLRARSPLQ